MWRRNLETIPYQTSSCKIGNICHDHSLLEQVNNYFFKKLSTFIEYKNPQTILKKLLGTVSSLSCSIGSQLLPCCKVWLAFGPKNEGDNILWAVMISL